MLTLRAGTGAPALVVELKAGGTPESALAQARARRYADALAAFPEVLLVGISYDPDPGSGAYKSHRCAIERA